MLCWKSSPNIIVFTSFVGERLNFCFTEMRRPNALVFYWHLYSSQHYHILQLFSSTFQMRFYGIFLYLRKLCYLLHWQLLKVIKINTIPIFRGKSENKVKYLCRCRPLRKTLCCSDRLCFSSNDTAKHSGIRWEPLWWATLSGLAACLFSSAWKAWRTRSDSSPQRRKNFPCAPRKALLPYPNTPLQVGGIRFRSYSSCFHFPSYTKTPWQAKRFHTK